MKTARPWRLDDESVAAMPDVFTAAGGAATTWQTQPAEQGVLGSRLVEIELARIRSDSPVQTRGFDPDTDPADRGLLESLRETGQKTPIVVRELETEAGDGPLYELQGGHRRVAALRRLGRERVTALVTRDAGSAIDLRALIDNLGQPLTLLQLGRCLLLIQERHGLTLSRVATLSGVPRQRLSEVEAVMSLHPALQGRVEAAVLSVRAAAFLRHWAPEQQQALAQALPAGGLSYERARAVDERVRAGETLERALAASGVAPRSAGAARPADTSGPLNVERPGASGPSMTSVPHESATSRCESALAPTSRSLTSEEPASMTAANPGAAPVRSSTPAAGWIETWLSAHYPALGESVRRALASELAIANPGAGVRPRVMRLAALLVGTGRAPALCAVDGRVLADSECGRTLATVEEQLARLEALQAGGRFSEACTDLLGALGRRLERLQSARRRGGPAEGSADRPAKNPNTQ
jgi:ParB/RepB/Spo0J family partition protein